MEFIIDPPNFDPKHTASGCIIKSGDKFLFLQRSKNWNETVWAIPAGKINPGENPEQALQREIMEETGIKLANFTRIKEFRMRIPRKNYDFKYFLFRADVPEGTEVKISDEHIDYRWVKKEEISELALETGAELYTDIINSQQPFIS